MSRVGTRVVEDLPNQSLGQPSELWLRSSDSEFQDAAITRIPKSARGNWSEWNKV